MKRIKTLERTQEAQSAFENSRFDEALRLFTAICDSEPSNSEAWWGRGNTLFQLARYKEAAESFQKTVELDGSNSEQWIGLGNALRLDEPQRAIEPLEHAVKLAPDNADAWFLLGLSLNSVGEFTRSVEAFDKAFTLNPEFSKNPERLRHRAESFTDAQRPTEAIPLLDLGLELIKNAKQKSAVQSETEQDLQGQLLLQKGLALNALGRFDEGVLALRQSADLLRGDEEKSLALMNESFALTALKQTPEALAILEKAAAIAPQNWIAGRIGLEQGAILNNLSKYGEAEPALNRALEFLPLEGPLAPMRAITWFHKGVALNSLSRFREGIDAFDKMSEAASELPPDIVALACFTKGSAQNKLGLPAEALATFAMAETQLLQGPLAPVVCFQKAIAFNVLSQGEAAIIALTAASEAGKQPGAIQIPVASLAYQKALALANLGQLPEALTAMAEATKADSALLDNVDVWMIRAALYIQTGHAADVIAEPPKAITDHPLVHAFQGNAFAVMGKPAEAIAAWQKASSPEGTARAGEPSAWIGFGMCRSFLQQQGEALKALDRAADLQSGLNNSPNIRMLRAVALGALGRHEEALESLKGALDLEPVWLVRGVALAALDRTEEALNAFEQGIALAKKSSFEATANLYNAALLLQKGLLLFRMERTSLALEAFEQGIESGLKVSEADPNYILSVLGKGWALEKLKRSEEAEKALIRAAQLSKALPEAFPNRSVAWWAFGEFLTHREREEEAVQAFNHALEMQPKNADSLLGRGRAFQTLEDFERAEADFTKAQDVAENDQEMFEALLGRGQSLNRLNRNDEAVAAYRRAVAFLSKDVQRKWRIWLSLGEAYQEMGRQQAALRAFQQGWRQDKRQKKSSDLALGIGAMLLDTQRDEEALTFLQEAKQKAEPDGRLDFNLGVAYYRRQQPEKAREAWTDAAKKKITQAEDYLRETETKQSAPSTWMDCWFGAERTKGRKFIGVLLVFLLALTCALPLLKEDALPWFNTGQDWTVTITAVAILAVLFLLPAIKRLSVGKDSLEIEMEPERPETSPLGPSSDSLLRRLTVIGLSMQQGASLSSGHVAGTLPSQATDADAMLNRVPIPSARTLTPKR
jgi:tetratricopeptide (TPR) repeat protein